MALPGRADDPAVTERLRRLARSILRRCAVTQDPSWRLNRCVFVGDAGRVSKDHLAQLARGGERYLACGPIHRGGKDVVRRPRRFRKIAENLGVREVVIGDGERRRRYAVCFNPEEARRPHRHRARVLEELTAEIESLRAFGDPDRGKRRCALRTSGRYGHYVCLSKAGRPRIDAAKVKAAERAEQAWRTLKSGLRLRPVYHGSVHHIYAHVALTVLAPLLERVAKHAGGDTQRDIRDDLKPIKLAQSPSPNGRVRQVTEPTHAAAKRPRSLQTQGPPPILNLA